MPTTQDKRQYQVILSGIGTPVLFYRMSGHEELSRPYEFAVEVLTEDEKLDPQKVLGKNLTVQVELPDEKLRYFNGIAVEFHELQPLSGYHRFLVKTVPWLWLLTRTADCQVFQDMTAVEIIEQVLKQDNGFSDFRRALSKTYSKRTYCVQYRETDFNFVSRLMEEEGISYYFEHSKGKNVLVLCDQPGSFTTGLQANVKYYPETEQSRDGGEVIYEWTQKSSMQPGKYVLRDYNFEKPKANLDATKSDPQAHAYGGLEIFDYPGGYSEANPGDSIVGTRMGEFSTRFSQFFAAGNSRAIEPGRRFTLTDHPETSQNVQYLATSAEYQFASDEFDIRGIDSRSGFYCKLSAQPATSLFYPQRLTPKPVVQGLQSAIVVGKSGEEIWTDEYGRVKVQFHWDRQGEKNENSSCWIRVAQVWAGSNWGTIHIPRIGQEVLVDFLEGDPDRPVVSGRLYNADNMPPYKLPDNQTQSGIVTRSTKTGEVKTFNELRFEDKKGQEEVYFHAEKDFERVVENNDKTRIGFDKMDPGDKTTEVYHNQNMTVGNNLDLVVGKELADPGNFNTSIQNDRTVVLEEGNDSLEVKKGTRTLVVESDLSETVTSGDHSLTVSSGKSTTDVSKAIVIKSDTSIELVVGSSSIKVEPTQITLVSTQIAIQGDAKIDATSPSTTVAGEGTLTLSGGMVKIN